MAELLIAILMLIFVITQWLWIRKQQKQAAEHRARWERLMDSLDRSD